MFPQQGPFCLGRVPRHPHGGLDCSLPCPLTSPRPHPAGPGSVLQPPPCSGRPSPSIPCLIPLWTLVQTQILPPVACFLIVTFLPLGCFSSTPTSVLTGNGAFLRSHYQPCCHTGLFPVLNKIYCISLLLLPSFPAFTKLIATFNIKRSEKTHLLHFMSHHIRTSL